MPARSDFRVIERLPDGTTLLEARPRSGRTNQLRVHLWNLGHPIVGDPTYQPDGMLESRQTLATGEPPMCLHAWKLVIRHPLRDETMEFEAPAPGWAGR